MAVPTLLALIVAVIAGSMGADASLDRIHVEGHHFTGSDGRTYLFHGINRVDKANKLVVITDHDIEIMKNYGVNMVRIGILWNLIEPKPGVFNKTYLDQLEVLVRRLASHGIYSMIENHQDVWSHLFCGHGVPNFYSTPYNTSEYKGQKGMKAFPKPMGEPAPGDPESFNTNVTENCDRSINPVIGWASTYLTYAIGAASQRLYDNDRGILDRFGDFWTEVAKRFAGNANVLGYGFINEPWLGDVPLNFADFFGKHRNLWFPGVADKTNLAKMNDYLNSRLRKIDNDVLVFYEPASGGNLLGALPVGFETVPGGTDYKNRSVLSYHVYCPLSESDIPIGRHKPMTKFLRWVWKNVVWFACDGLNTIQYSIRACDVQRLGGAGFMTEFGQVAPDEDGLKVINLAMKKMDEYMHSWSYWDGFPVKPPIAYSIARTYPQITAGDLINIKFDPHSSKFQMKFKASATANRTEIFASKVYHYGNNLCCTIAPKDAASCAYTPNNNTVLVTHKKEFVGKEIVVSIGRTCSYMYSMAEKR